MYNFRNLSMSDNIDIQVASFVPKPVMSEPEREMWPSQGMPCEVQGCTSPHFHKFDYYIRHWIQYHERFIYIFTCNMPGCKAKFPTKYATRRHYTQVHLLNEGEIKELNITPHKEHNRYFKNPQGLLPRKYVKPVNEKAREEARRQRQQYAMEHHVEFPNLPTNREVNRGEYMDFNFNNNTSKIVTRW